MDWAQLNYSSACVSWTLMCLSSAAASSPGDTTSRRWLAAIWGYRDNWVTCLIIQSGGSRFTRVARGQVPMHKHFSSFCLHYFCQCPIDQSKLEGSFKRNETDHLLTDLQCQCKVMDSGKRNICGNFFSATGTNPPPPVLEP